jgi:N-acetylglucosaminyltransferase
VGTLVGDLLPPASDVAAAAATATATAYLVLLASASLSQRLFAWLHPRRVKSQAMTEASAYRPSVDVVVPCFEERPGPLKRCLDSLANQDYQYLGGQLRVWIVDDGSSNVAELRPLYQQYTRRPGWELIELPHNKGKRRAQDAAVRIGHGELVVSIDSDTLVAPDGIRRIVAPFWDREVGMATGNVRAANWEQNRLTQVVDERYKVLFEQERAAQSYFGSVLCCSGSFAVYRRSALHDVWESYLNQTFRGAPCTWGEDLHLTTQLMDEGYRSVYEPAARAATVVPATIKSYVRQQLRWNRSLYRELPWMIPLLRRRSRYLSLDVAARIVLPLLLPIALVATIAEAIVNPAALPGDATILAIVAMSQLVLGLLQTGSLRFSLVYGLLHFFLLIPTRIFALFTLRDTSWCTRGNQGGKARLAVGWQAFVQGAGVVGALCSLPTRLVGRWRAGMGADLPGDELDMLVARLWCTGRPVPAGSADCFSDTQTVQREQVVAEGL